MEEGKGLKEGERRTKAKIDLLLTQRFVSPPPPPPFERHFSI